MSKGDHTLHTLVFAAALAVGVAYFAPRYLSSRTPGVQVTSAQTQLPPVRTVQPSQPAAVWLASAPGRIEPNGGEIRLTAQAPGRIAEMLAKVGERVNAGDLLLRLDDGELEARVSAAEAEVAARRRERDNETVTGPARDRRNAEDAIANADRLLAINRAELDRWVRAQRAGNATTEDVQKVRDLVKTTRDRAEAARSNLRRLIATDNPPAQTRVEAGLALARAELALAEATLERTRVRAPSNGSILAVSALVGESAAPSAEQVLVTLGDLSALRVRAEIDERDAGKLRMGQVAVIRADAIPGREFEGKVVLMSQALTPARLSQKGPRKTTDVDVLEVVIDLGAQTQLMPGMRVDVFVRPDATAKVQ